MPTSPARPIACIALATLLVAASAAPASAQGGSPAGLEVIESVVLAHGGMDRWASAPTVSFTDEFKPGLAEEGLVSRVTVEQGRRRAYIDFPTMEGMYLAWDGERAWSENWQLPYPPRFMAQLNYYFLNLPWLTLDPGVFLGEPGTGRILDDPTDYITIKMTFDDSAGDTPDDYYVLYIDPDTRRLRGTEYVVTYRALLPAGANATDPHVLVFEEHKTVDGLVVPTRYTIYELDGTVYGTCDIWKWSFSETFDEARMMMPTGAVVDESTP